MARMPKFVLPAYPNPLTQKGDRRQRTFFNSADYHRYLELIVGTKKKRQLKLGSIA